MEKLNLEIVKALFVQLEQYLKEYGDNDIANQYRIVKNIIYTINSDMEEGEKISSIVCNYKKLFPARGGLSEFYIWNDDFKKRKELNAPFNEIRENLWNIMKNYI